MLLLSRDGDESEDFLVDQGGTVGLGQPEPDEEGELQQEIEGDVLDEDGGQGLEDDEEGEDDPVGQPLGVVGLLGGVDRLERGVGRVPEARDVDDELCAESGGSQHDKQGCQAEDDVRLEVGGVLERGDLLIQLLEKRDRIQLLFQSLKMFHCLFKILSVKKIKIKIIWLFFCYFF